MDELHVLFLSEKGEYHDSRKIIPEQGRFHPEPVKQFTNRN